MLDFTRLKTPPNDGDVLVVPDPRALAALVRENAERLRRLEVPILGEPLSEWRRRTRGSIAGQCDHPVVVTGHQPAFSHPGVWAKHVVASRLSEAVAGQAVNLIVDSDAPKQTALRIPSETLGEWTIRTVMFPSPPAGGAYEQIPLQPAGRLDSLRDAARDAMGERYARSLLPEFFEHLLQADSARDWVDQLCLARQRIEAGFGVAVRDCRVSDGRWAPLLFAMILDAGHFAASYNRALAAFRRQHGIRDTRRPIPDLEICGDTIELPVWAYRADEPRRRLFAIAESDGVRVTADGTPVDVIPIRDFASLHDPVRWTAVIDGWRLRPRALALTIWARLFLADLFIHGIGGAKYDRIADAIIADHFGLPPPEMACVSATLHLGLPGSAATVDTVRAVRHELRDLQWNPQRHLPASQQDAVLLERRAAAVRLANDLCAHHPRDRSARHAAFLAIRDAAAGLLARHPGARSAVQERLDRAIHELRQGEIARGREYFFVLYDRTRIQRLLDALPDTSDLRV